jgi:hypothetical protein
VFPLAKHVYHLFSILLFVLNLLTPLTSSFRSSRRLSNYSFCLFLQTKKTVNFPLNPSAIRVKITFFREKMFMIWSSRVYMSVNHLRSYDLSIEKQVMCKK